LVGHHLTVSGRLFADEEVVVVVDAAGAGIVFHEELLLGAAGQGLPVDAFASGEIGKDVVFLFVRDFLHVVGAGDDHGGREWRASTG
jgi:hypothetical protein